MSEPRISVCVPVYNVEAYLPRCLDSILSQTFTDFELIIVNDASPDNSEEIIKKYLEQDERIRYVKHEANRSLPQARKSAVQIAKGEYYAFVDSDDWVEPHYLETLYRETKTQNAEITICAYYQEYESREEEIIDPNSRKKNLFSSVSFWNKLFHRRLFDTMDFDFPSTFMGEDLMVVPRLFLAARKIAYTSEVLYHYIFQEDRWIILTVDKLISKKEAYLSSLIYFKKKKRVREVDYLRYSFTNLTFQTYRYMIIHNHREELLKAIECIKDLEKIYYKSVLVSWFIYQLLRRVLQNAFMFQLMRITLVHKIAFKIAMIGINIRYKLKIYMM